MANDNKDHALKKIFQDPIDEKDKDLLTFSLYAPIRKPSPPRQPLPDLQPPPPPQPLLQSPPMFDSSYQMLTTSVYGFSPFISQYCHPLPLLPQNPNPNFPAAPEDSEQQWAPLHRRSDQVLYYSHPLLPQNPNPNSMAPPPAEQQRAPGPGPMRRAGRGRRNRSAPTLGPGKSEIIPAPHPWATTRRATVRSTKELSLVGIEKVTGEVQCRRCEKRFSAGYDVQAEFSKIGLFIAEKKASLDQRSPKEWDNPALLDCKVCGQKGCAKPVMAAKKRDINWLFLLLGGFLSLCSLEQLKYFCKHTGNHRTGAKDRLLYLTYLGLCKQLDPSGPFDVLV